MSPTKKGPAPRPRPRRAELRRTTKETAIHVRLDLDGTGTASVETGIPFFDHMLAQLARHGLLNLVIEARGDLPIDPHHTVEDVGITLGQVLAEALGDKVGIVRFASASVPMGEARADIALDICGRAHLVWDVPFPNPKTGAFDTVLVEHFFESLAAHADLTLHVQVPYGKNDHHIAEAIFKGVAHCLYQALRRDPRKGLPSTKGIL